VNFFEIDYPATACLKARGIDEMGQRENLHLIPGDLGKRKLVDVMEANDAWDKTAQTVILAEGLLMYLPPKAVRDLIGQCAAVTGTGSRMAFTYIPTCADGRPDAGRWTGLVLWILKISGEPWLWSIRPEELGPFLDKKGWTNAPDLVGSSGEHGVEFYAVATK
jgi:methyltransferase (TIGR00027 family)